MPLPRCDRCKFLVRQPVSILYRLVTVAIVIFSHAYRVRSPI
ncbi:hypothetical protein PQG02_20515 [Nostoc sp. UHCC 0926]|nr:hypothetical protein PQG02_20515 [Nostoc sp. UHCC 0926]